MKRAFTIIELIVSIAIFALMTALVVVKYGTFNDSILLTNAAYDVAGVIRTAQTYGLSVKNDSAVSTNFDSAYGVHFNRTTPGIDVVSGLPLNQTIVLFSDTNNNRVYDEDERITTYTLKQGAIISNMSESNSTFSLIGSLVDIMFKRPNPDAIMISNANPGLEQPYIVIFIKGKDDSIRKVGVRANGQISILD